MFGDPHIKTIDGLPYTYNGLGEYWLVKSDMFDMQGRTSQAWDSNDQPVLASIFSAFSAQDKTDPPVPVTTTRSPDVTVASPRLHIALDQPRTSKINLAPNQTI